MSQGRDIGERQGGDEVLDLLVCAARSFVTGTGLDELALACERVGDWDAVREKAVEHGSLPVVRAQLRKLDGGVVTDAAVSRFDEAYRSQAIRTLVCTTELEGCLSALNERGIEPVVLKGPALGLTLYEDPAMRPFTDIDIMIAEDDWAAFREALLASGATPLGRDFRELPPRLHPAETLDHWLTFRTAGGLAIECTFDPLQLGVGTRSLARFLDTARPLPVGRAHARTLTDETQVLALCVHLNRHGFARLGWWTDIALLIERRRDAIDWESFCELARREGVATPVALTLERVAALFRIRLPDVVRRRLRPAPLRAALWRRTWPDEEAARFVGVHEGPLVFYKSARMHGVARLVSWNLVNLPLMGRYPEKLAFVARWLFPPKSFLLAKQGVDRGAYARLWLRRATRRPKVDGNAPAATTPSVTPEEDAFGRSVVRGVGWSSVARVVNPGVQFFVTLVLARLLLPAEFGLAGMAAIVTMLVAMVTEFGFGTALVQKRDVTEDDVSTAFWTSLTLGVAMCLLCMAASPLAAAAFRTPQVQPVIVYSAIGLIIGAFAIVPRAMLLRRLDFKSCAIAETCASAAYAVSSIALALSGAGVWSLVVAGLVQATARTALMLWSGRIGLRFRVSRASLEKLLPFGLRMLGANLVSYARGNVDYFVVGTALGAAPLGLYTLAFKMADFSRVKLAATITDVALPALSALQDETERFKRGYFRSLGAIAGVSFPALTGLAIIAPEFVRTMYGPRWEPSVAPLQLLLLMGLLLAPSEAATTVIVALGRAELNLRLSAAFFAAVTLFAILGVRWGIVGVAGGVSVATALYFVGQQTVLLRVAGVHPLESIREVRIPILSSASMAVALGAYRWVTGGQGSGGFLWLAVAVVIGVLVYACSLMVLVPRSARREFLRHVRPRRAAGSVPDQISA